MTAQKPADEGLSATEQKLAVYLLILDERGQLFSGALKTWLTKADKKCPRIKVVLRKLLTLSSATNKRSCSATRKLKRKKPLPGERLFTRQLNQA
jgi:hypothetical protein